MERDERFLPAMITYQSESGGGVRNYEKVDNIMYVQRLTVHVRTIILLH